MSPLIIGALAVGFQSTGAIPVEQVSFQGSGCPVSGTLVRQSNWDTNVSFSNFQVGDTYDSQECTLTLNLGLLGGCLDGAYLINTIQSSLPPDNKGLLSIQLSFDGKEEALNQVTLDGSKTALTKQVSEPIKRVCGESIILTVKTKAQASSPANSSQNFALVNQYLSMTRITSPYYSAALERNPLPLAVAIVVLAALKEMLE